MEHELSEEPRKEPHRLDYAERPPVRRKWLVRLVVVAALMIVAAVVYRSRQDINDWLLLVRLRHAVLNHSVPPGTVVMRQLPEDRRDSWSNTTAARYAPADAVWQQAEMRLVPRLRSVPGSSVTVFLHERMSPSGNRRVVAVNLSRTRWPEGVSLDIDVRLFDPGSIWRPGFTELAVSESPDLRQSGSIPEFPGGLYTLATVAWGSDFHLLAGVPDPEDRSRLLIDYVHNGVEGTIAISLMDDDGFRFSTVDGRPLPLELE